MSAPSAGFPIPAHLPPDPIDRLIAIAVSQVGYHEGRDASGSWNNLEKYAAQVPGLAWVSTGHQPWCATFVSWDALEAGLAAYFPCTASTDAAAAWFKDRGEWHDYPAVGAQVLYGHGGDMVHTGIVTGYDAHSITTVEGNTNNNGSAEGDGVYRKVRVRTDSFIQGYGYPSIPGVVLKSADPAYHPGKPAKAHIGPHIAAAIAELEKAKPKDARTKAMVAKALKHLGAEATP